MSRARSVICSGLAVVTRPCGRRSASLSVALFVTFSPPSLPPHGWGGYSSTVHMPAMPMQLFPPLILEEVWWGSRPPRPHGLVADPLPSWPTAWCRLALQRRYQRRQPMSKPRVAYAAATFAHLSGPSLVLVEEVLALHPLALTNLDQAIDRSVLDEPGHRVGFVALLGRQCDHLIGSVQATFLVLPQTLQEPVQDARALWDQVTASVVRNLSLTLEHGGERHQFRPAPDGVIVTVELGRVVGGDPKNALRSPLHRFAVQWPGSDLVPTRQPLQKIFVKDRTLCGLRGSDESTANQRM